jgi:hypothetical protein
LRLLLFIVPEEPKKRKKDLKFEKLTVRGIEGIGFLSLKKDFS